MFLTELEAYQRCEQDHQDNSITDAIDVCSQQNSKHKFLLDSLLRSTDEERGGGHT